VADARELARNLLLRQNPGAAGIPAGPAAPAARRVPARAAVSLSEHPEVIQALQRDEMLHAGLAELGAPSPYYVPHGGVNGATTVVDGRSLINFSGYNYLGLAGDPRVQAAAKEAIDTYGTSCSASRIVSGQIPLHAELESRIAGAYGVDGAVMTGSGFLTNAAVIAFVLGAGDVAVCDSLVHNSIVAGTKWAGCQRVTFRHNDPEALEGLLRRSRDHFERAMVIIEGVYSMDGDIVRLPELVEVARRYGCLVMVDEAHSFGVLGASGSGVHEHFAVPGDAVDIWMGTLSKSLASYGGYLAGSADFVFALKMAAPGVNMYAAGATPATTAAAIAAFDIMVSEPERLVRLIANGRTFAAGARAAGLDAGTTSGTPIVPVVLGDTRRTVTASVALLDAGINASPILYPAVAEADARIRFFITAEHTADQIDYTISTLAAHLQG
jgi:8-amino-7-oxononanoate synthase